MEGITKGRTTDHMTWEELKQEIDCMTPDQLAGDVTVMSPKFRTGAADVTKLSRLESNDDRLGQMVIRIQEQT